MFLPYIKNTTDRIGKLLEKYNIKPIKPTKKIQECLRSAKDTSDPLATPGVYRIPCSCGSVYIGTTKRSIKTRITEHKRSCRLGHVEKSALAEHALTLDDHKILFEDTQVLDRTRSYYPRIYREAIEIQKHAQNFNRKDEGLNLSRTWTTVLRNAKLTNRKRLVYDPTENQKRRVYDPTENLPAQGIKDETVPVIDALACEPSRRTLRPLPHRL